MLLVVAFTQSVHLTNCRNSLSHVAFVCEYWLNYCIKDMEHYFGGSLPRQLVRLRTEKRALRAWSYKYDRRFRNITDDFVTIVVIITGIFMAIIFILNYTIRLSETKNISGSANAYFPECVRPWTIPLTIGLNMLPSASLMSCLDSLPGYSTGAFQALQLIVFAVFGAGD